MLKFEEGVWPPTPESTSFDVIGQIAIDRAVEAVEWKEGQAQWAARADREPIRDGVREKYIADTSGLGLNASSLLISSFGLERALAIYESLAESIESEKIRDTFWIGFYVRSATGGEEARPEGSSTYMVAQWNRELGKCELVPRPPVEHEIVLPKSESAEPAEAIAA